MRALVLLVLALALGGCATEPRRLVFDGGEADAGLVWPAPQTQELPRYRYLGQLVGEQNFRTANGPNRSGAGRLFAWIAGLSGEVDQPVVLQRPQSGVVDPQGRILVTDVSRNAVFVFDEARGRLEVWDQAGGRQRFVAPIGVAIGRGGEVLVTDAELGRVFRLDSQGKPLGEFGRGVLQRPTGIARDAAGQRIFVADTQAHDIKVFSDDGELIGRWGHRGDGPGELNFPTHLAFSNGTLIVCDSMNARVQGFDDDGEPTLRFGERGLYVGNLVRPKGVASDDEGNLYVVESMHDTLLVFDRQGQLLLPIGGTGTQAGQFFLPAGVWVDSRNRVFVADMFNGRVAVFQFLGGL
ncbi:MAG TPA: 6-bladed beta-propeller [Albitalea sp.]